MRRKPTPQKEIGEPLLSISKFERQKKGVAVLVRRALLVRLVLIFFISFVDLIAKGT